MFGRPSNAPPGSAPLSGRRGRTASVLALAACAALAGTHGVARAHESVTASVLGEASVGVRLNILVFDDKQPAIAAIMDRLRKQGMPMTVVDLTAPGRVAYTATDLATTTGGEVLANFSGIVLPNDAPAGMSSTELNLLDDYSTTFKVRQVLAYTYARPNVGLNPPDQGGYAGPLDGKGTKLTTAAQAGPFSYLKTGPAFDNESAPIIEAYGYLSTPYTRGSGVFTPLLTAPIPGHDGVDGSLIGQYSKDGREKLVMTFGANAGHLHWNLLAPGIVRWLTRDVGLTHNRNYLAVQVDDIFLRNALWKEDAHCTVGLDCDATKYPLEGAGNTAVMQPVDATYLVNWQKAHGDFKIDMVFNGFGRTGQGVEFAKAVQPLQGEFRWASHTWSHRFLGCDRDLTTLPWKCKQAPNGQIAWVSRPVVDDELRRNYSSARADGGLTNFSTKELITGEHSGLKTLPQESLDNPNLVEAIKAQGFEWVASDASRERDSRLIGGARTVPRYPMNVYFNTATKRQAADEYTWMNSSVADGGSGLCTKLGFVCYAPISKETGFDQVIVPSEGRRTFLHVIANDPRPHYAHQINLTQDRLLLPVLERTLELYQAYFNASAPRVNPTLSEAGKALNDMQSWQAMAGSVKAVLRGTSLTLSNSGTTPVEVPVTVPDSGATGPWKPTPYAGSQSGFTAVAAQGAATLTLAKPSGFATTATWPHAPAAYGSAGRGTAVDSAPVGPPSQFVPSREVSAHSAGSCGPH